ncbi:MAG: sugar transferase [Rickettsiales bacterium]|nr:sugar transferase [Rickettsiales bacterium]
MYKFFLKRAIEFILSLSGLIFLMPIYLVIIILVRTNLGSPIFFKKKRPGLNNKVFNIYKFRTMTNDHDHYGNLLPDETRLTKFGRFLRSTSLDELPSLWSVLKGDMSLIGPRPLLVEYLPFFSEKQARRHEVRPGITGWAQVNGRNAISWEEKFELDVWYVDNLSITIDIKILWLTIIRVLFRDGISPDNKDIMPRFDTMMNERKDSNEK